MPKIKEVKPLEANTCFGCGEENSVGLKLNFQWDGSRARANFIARKEYEGWPGLIHGGIVFTLLDEATSWVSRYKGINTLTARAEVRYRKPLRVGDKASLIAGVIKETSRVLEAKATLSLDDGTVIAEADSTMFIIENMEEFINFKEVAVIWDLDGVLVDTSTWHFSAWKDTFKRRGVDFSQEDFRASFGMRNDRIIRKILGDSISDEDIQYIAREKENHFRSKISGDLRPLPGAMELLDALKSNTYKMALATSAPRENVEALLESLGISKYFDAIVADEDVKRGKPDPEVFLKAAERLGVKARDCLVIEDSLAGIQAARGAGMKCIALSSTHPAEKLSQADLVVSSMEEVGQEKIQELLRK